MTRALVIFLAIAGCDDPELRAQAKALEKADAEKKAAEEKAAADRKAQREKKAKEEEDAKAAKEAALAELVGLPDKVPKKLEKACKAMLAAYDAYMSKVLTGDLKTKWDTGGNAAQLKIYGVECRKRNTQVAACQTFALGKMGPEHKPEMGDIFTRCAQKYGGA